MEEVCYLDSAALVRYELPEGWKMTVDERMGVNDPQPTGEARFYRRWMAPVAAKDEAGRDVSEILNKRGGKGGERFELGRRVVGVSEDNLVGVEFYRGIERQEMI